MDILKKTKTAAKQPLSSFVLSLSFHALVLALFIIPHFHTEVPQQKEYSVIEASLVDYAKPVKKEIAVSSETKSRTFSVASKTVKKITSVAVSKPAPAIAHITKESLQNDMRYVAENAVFGKVSAGQTFEAKFSSSYAYRSYVDAFRDKLARAENATNKTIPDGTVTLHVTIGKNGEVIERSADDFDSLNLASAALQAVDTVSTVGPFPKNLPLEAIKISLNLHFVTQ
jgi:hypothetical protein